MQLIFSVDHLIPIEVSLQGHHQQFRVPFARTLIYQKTFFPDAIRMWNSLPADVVQCTSADTLVTLEAE